MPRMPTDPPPTGWPGIEPHPFNAAAPFGIGEVWTAATHDLFGTKDVQDAITASYVWMADQIGHVFFGLALTLLPCWGWFRAFPSVQGLLLGPSGAHGLPSVLLDCAGYAVAALLVF